MNSNTPHPKSNISQRIIFPPERKSQPNTSNRDYRIDDVKLGFIIGGVATAALIVMVFMITHYL